MCFNWQIKNNETRTLQLDTDTEVPEFFSSKVIHY